VAGNRQTRSTIYDPAIQFSVHEIELAAPDGITLTGRCWFGPVSTGAVFTRVAAQDGEVWTPRSDCRLQVESIQVFDRNVESIDQTWSARLRLVGDAASISVIGTQQERLLLVGDDPTPGSWAWNGNLWVAP